MQWENLENCKDWMICKYFREDLMVPRGDNPKKKMGKGIYTAGH